MNGTRILYRLRQFWDVLRNRPLTERELAVVQDVLTDQQMALFLQLQPAEQQHALRVLQAVQHEGEAHPDLLVAALLHDIGKIRHPLRLWERVVIVLGKRFFPYQAQKWGGVEHRGWARPFKVASTHPAWGAELAQRVGVSPEAVRLIQEHQKESPPHENEEDRFLSILQKADRNN